MYGKFNYIKINEFINREKISANAKFNRAGIQSKHFEFNGP